MAALLDSTSPSVGTEEVDEEISHSAGSEVLEVTGPGLDAELRSSFAKFWETKTLTDVVLVAGEQRFEVHGLILASHSEYIKKLLVDSTSRSEGKLEIILDVNPELLRFVLAFLYKGSMNVPLCSFTELIVASESLGLNYLRDRCRLVLLQNIEVTYDNCLEMLSIAFSVQDDQLLAKSLPVALENFTKLQHDQSFRTLPVECLKQYLGHPDLQVQNADIRLAAALKWAQEDARTRGQYLSDILDHLPLRQMEWYLDQALHEKIIRENPDAKLKLEQALEGPQGSPTENVLALKRERCLLFVGHEMFTNGKWASPSNEVIGIRLDKNFQVIKLGEINAEFLSGSNLCMVDGQMYVFGLGQDRREIWRFNLQDGTSLKIGSLLEGRREFGITALKNGKVYIMGGRKNLGEGEVSEVFDPRNNKCQTQGSITNRDSFRKVVCRVLQGSDDILVAGAGDGSNNYLFQVYSTGSGKVQQKVEAKGKSKQSYGIAQKGKKIIAMSTNATITCTVKENNEIAKESVKVSEKYIVPNEGCAVVQTSDDVIHLIGGCVRERYLQIYKSVYKAQFNDVFNDTGLGWQPVESAWSFGQCYLPGYCIANLEV